MGSISLKANNLLYSPIAFWHLEESSGNRVDATNHGWTLVEGASSVSNTTGKVGNAASFDGTSSKFLKNSSISVGSTFSISCWVKLNSYNPNDARAIWGIGAPNSTTDPITLFVDTSSHFFGIYNSQGGYITTNTVANLDTWYHVVSVFTPNDMKLYINGTLAGSETYVGAVDNSWTYFSLSNYYDGGATPAYPIDAIIDEVGIWDLALTSDQILTLYNNPAALNNNINNTKISIKTTNAGGGEIISNQNYILNSKFDADNQYPIYDGSEFFDNNYFMEGNCNGAIGCDLLTNYKHNSPLFYIPISDNYHTFANRTFHQINAPYNVLPIGHPIQPRLIKMFGAGTTFSRSQSYLQTIINTTSFSVSPPANTSWTKYGVEQIVTIPSWATKVVYGVKYLAKSDDLFRGNNFGGLKLNFRLTAYRNYINIHLIRRNTAAAVDTLESLYGSNIYTYFNNDLGSLATYQWLGPQVSKVKIRKRSSTTIDSNADKFIKIYDTIDIPTFSSSYAESDWGNGRPTTVSLEMFFAEWNSYLNDDAVSSGSIYFYEPFLYFKY